MARLVTAVLVVAFAFTGISAPTSAEPSKAELNAARAKLQAMNERMDVLTEEYDRAMVELEETQAKLEDAQAEVDKASSAAQQARSALGERTAAAYEGGVTSRLDLILGAGSFTELSDRLEFLNRLAAKDSDAATQAEVTGQQAQWATDTYQRLKAQEQQQAAALQQKRDEIEKAAGEQQDLIQKLQEQYKAAMKAAREAEKEAAAEAAAAEASGGGGGEAEVTGPAPPVSSRASVAVAWAHKAVGAEYQWGAAGPDEFDCSGLTMWAWGHAGVSLPHSSAAQYGAVPHVSKSDLQPGDLLFFYSPISHVSIYIGGGQEIDASHEGVPVSIQTPNWGSFVGAGRPG